MTECPACGTVVALDSADNMEEHSYHGSGRCAGSGVNADALYEELQRW